MVQATPFRITETAQLDAAGASNDITVQPGDEETIVEYEAQTRGLMYLLALGATDRSETSYRLYVDNDLKFETRSPLGIVNDPFAFKRDVGFLYPARDLIEYRVHRDSGASAADYVGRMYVTERETTQVRSQREG